MLEKPALPETTIVAALAASHGVAVKHLTFLPFGQDAHAWLYRVDARAAQTYFLKVRRPPPNELSLALPRYLRDSGFEQAVAPLPTRDGALWGAAGDFILQLYPFIVGRTGMDGGLTPDLWEILGGALHRLHTSFVPEELARVIPRERFTQPPGVISIINDVLAGRHAAPVANAAPQDLAAFLRRHREDIRHMLDRIDALGHLLRERRHSFVLCHADLHINNVLVDLHDRVWIVDWDQPLFALPERDLMCVLGPAMQGVMPGSVEEAALMRGYGPLEIDARALTYYRYERALQDIAENAEQVYWMPAIGEETRRHAAQRLLRSFTQGRQVDEAFRSDARPVAQQ